MLSGCHKENRSDFTFLSKIEQPTNSDGSKVYLLDERWIYWEVGDIISIGSDQNNCWDGEQYTARLVNTSDYAGSELYEDYGEYFNGVFITTMDWGSSYFLGLHPQSDKNVIKNTGGNNFTVKIDVPQTQPLRIDGRPDNTFGKDVMPMVAWYGGTWDTPERAYNLDFHSLGAIVRLQVFDNSGSTHSIDRIEITSNDSHRQLSGMFEVEGYKTEDPNLKIAANTEDNRKIILDNSKGNGTITLDSLRSFYLVLPAYKGRHDSTTFDLKMTVYSGSLSCSKDFTVTTRRNGITYMRAIGLSDWSSTLQPSQHIVGNGTLERPFKIYTIEDLNYLRNCYDNENPKINGITVTDKTEIRIMRSDIELTTANWGTEATNYGIKQFKGHIKYIAAKPTGITNKTNLPLFHSISAQGNVEGITVYCNSNISFTGNEESVFSPFCRENSGTIKDCAIRTASGISITAADGNLAGICTVNQGTIDGCRCEASLVSTNSNAAGICYTNSGTIRGSHATSMMTISAPAGNAAGICYSNTSTGAVYDSYFATRITNGDCNWGGIAYSSQGLVEHCYIGTTGQIGCVHLGTSTCIFQIHFIFTCTVANFSCGNPFTVFPRGISAFCQTCPH